MARTILDAQLHKICTETIKLGTLVVTALDLALQALQSKDLALYSQVIESDNAIDTLRFEVERLAFRSLTLQQPLGGRDLRFLSSIPAIVADLERIGDNAAGITKLLLLMAPLQVPSTNRVQSRPADGDQKSLLGDNITEDSIVSKLLGLGQEACRVLRGTMYAFGQSDARAAREIWREDDVVDVCYHLARHDLMTMLTSVHAIPALQQDSFILQRMTYWLWIAHKLERVGDHCTNICERTVFFLEGVTVIQPIEIE
jgi:phosphate transport system protein